MPDPIAEPIPIPEPTKESIPVPDSVTVDAKNPPWDSIDPIKLVKDAYREGFLDGRKYVLEAQKEPTAKKKGLFGL